MVTQIQKLIIYKRQLLKKHFYQKIYLQGRKYLCRDILLFQFKLLTKPPTMYKKTPSFDSHTGAVLSCFLSFCLGKTFIDIMFFGIILKRTILLVMLCALKEF